MSSAGVIPAYQTAHKRPCPVTAKLGIPENFRLEGEYGSAAAGFFINWGEGEIAAEVSAFNAFAARQRHAIPKEFCNRFFILWRNIVPNQIRWGFYS